MEQAPFKKDNEHLPSIAGVAEAPEAERIGERSAEAPSDGGIIDHECETGRRTLANVYCDPERHTVTLLLDDLTATTVIYAIRMLAADSEAHAREVRLVAGTMPLDSDGAANRHAIAARDERIALRLRAVESNYRDIVITPGKALKV